MENLWIQFVFIYSFLKGTREGMKKAALAKSNSIEILFFFAAICLKFILLPMELSDSPMNSCAGMLTEGSGDLSPLHSV